MSKHLYLFLFTLIAVACSTDDQHFKIDGRLLHLNQGEFYVYSPDGDLGKLDTIKVEAGRFTYEIQCRRPMTLMIVFPNFTEQPVFAEPGKTVKITGSASNLKEMQVKGTNDNKLMNTFREQIVSASPPDTRKYARQFVIDHPQSIVGSYLVRRYFIQSPEPDFALADSLLTLMLSHQESYGYLHQLRQSIAGRSERRTDTPLPKFKTTTIEGDTLTDATLKAAPLAVVCAWASWNYESINVVRQLSMMRKEGENDFALLTVNVDANIGDCRRSLRTNNITADVVNDGLMVAGPLYRQLGFCYVPDNIVVKNGRIVGRRLTMEELKKQINK